MRILQLCKKFPFPLKDGESLATTYLAKALHEQGCEVTLLSMNTSKHRADLSQLPHDFDHYQAIHAVEVDNHLRPFDALRNLLFSSDSYHVERFVVAEFEQQLIHLLKQQHFDVVQMETIFLSNYVPIVRRYSDALVVMRSHNVEHEIWERVAQTSSPLKKWYLQTINPRLKQYEQTHLNNYDLVACISKRDLEQYHQLGLKQHAVVTPIGLDSRDYQPDYGAYMRPLSLAFIGSLDWMPNQDGLEWFLETIWRPLIQPRFPQLTFHIAGRNTPERFLRLQMPGVVVHGEVPSAREFLNRHAISVVPLLSGGGMRAKILESMALGRVTISTAVGLEGIDATHEQQVLVADTPEQWLTQIEWCVAAHQAQALQQLGERASVFCKENYDNLGVSTRLLQTYRAMYESKLKPAVVAGYE
jgi:polysaccharide biosynthesis protein PslH